MGSPVEIGGSRLILLPITNSMQSGMCMSAPRLPPEPAAVAPRCFGICAAMANTQDAGVGMSSQESDQSGDILRFMFKHEGPARSPRTNAVLAGYLALVAGFVNSG